MASAAAAGALAGFVAGLLASIAGATLMQLLRRRKARRTVAQLRKRVG